MLIARLTQALRELGADVSVATEPSLKTVRPDALIDLAFAGQQRRLAVEERRRAPYPSELNRLWPLRERLAELGSPFLVAPYVSERLGDELIQHGWSWADAEGNYDLAIPPLRLRNRAQSKKPASTGTRFPKSSAGLRIVRALIACPKPFRDHLTQARLAGAAGVTQPRVSQVLSGLQADDLVQMRGRRLEWDRATLLDAFLDTYAGPGGIEHYLYSLDPPRQTGPHLLDLLPHGSMVLSADLGADLLAPSRRPTHLIAYHRAGDLAQIAPPDAVSVTSVAEANIILCEPADDSVFGPLGLPTTARIDGRPVPLADPTQILWDLRRLGGRDRSDAADELKRWILSSNR